MTKGIRLVGLISVALVALVAAIVSYTHIQTVAERAGQGWASWLLPLSVDGLLVGASLVVYVRRQSGRAWLAVIAGLLVSLAANLAAAEPTLTSRLVSAWPAIALALSYETLLTLVRHQPTVEPTTNTTTADTNQDKAPAHTIGTSIELKQPIAAEETPEPSPPDNTPAPVPTNGFTFGDPNAWARIANGSK